MLLWIKTYTKCIYVNVVLNQVIQQTLHRPQSMTAQYLQQMYAAQQQHILLQTAAFQQQHQQNLTAAQILSTTQQV